MLNGTGKLINPELRIENTNRCNATCVICPREKMTRAKVDMCWGMFVDVLEQAIALGISDIALFGYGEPLLDATIAAKIDYASSRGVTTHLTTNAFFLTQELARELLEAGLKHIRFSVHAISPLLYSNVHRGLNWFTVTKNMFNFIDMNKAKGKPCTTHLTVIPMHGESVNEIREVWEKATDFLEIWRPHNWGGGRGFRRGIAHKRCGRPFNGPVQVQADGKVIPCCFLTNGEIILGDLNEQSLLAVLQGGEYIKLQRRHRENDLAGLPCHTCDQRYEYKKSPLLYSNRDPEMELNKTSTCKVKIV